MASTYYPLAHPKVTEARKAFGKLKRTQKTLRKRMLTFDDLYRLFCDESLSFAEISRRTGLHPSTIQRFQDDTFFAITGNKLGADRYEARIEAATARTRARLASAIPKSEAAQAIAAQARARGHTVEACIMADRLMVAKSRIVVSGTPCLMHPIRKANRPSASHRLKYGIALIHRDKLREHPVHLFPILVNGKRDTYVIPSEALMALFAGSEHAQERIYIPLHAANEGGVTRSHARIDLDPYRNAWHLIPRAA